MVDTKVVVTNNRICGVKGKRAGSKEKRVIMGPL